MSRVGKQAVEIPAGVTVTLGDTHIAVKGSKGQLSVAQNQHVVVTQEDGKLFFTPNNKSKPARAAHGLMRALCANMVQGVSKGFERQLQVNGVGYRADVKGDVLNLQLGYSHPIEFKLPAGISAVVNKNLIVLSGIDKHLLGQTAAKVRAFRPPEPYKGKGIKYVEEHIVRKVGKAAG